MGSFELVRFRDDEFELDVNVSPEEDTVWLTKDEIALLFDRDRTVISRHIKNIFKEGELDEQRVCAKNARTGPDGKTYIVEYYNLDVIISTGYRVKSKRGIIFRQWANTVLKHYLMKGYALYSNRILITKENYLRLENDIESIKKEIERIKEQTFLEPVKQRLFYDGQYFDAFDFICSLIINAKESVILIDPYFDETGLHYLKKRKGNVKMSVCISSNSKLDANDIKQFKKQYGQIDIIKKDVFHDRYLIIDNSICYSLGASLNHMGKRVFSVNLIEDKDIVRLIIDKLGA